MDYHIDLEGLPSDAFSDDFELDHPPSETDYSSWPAESSPPPARVDEEDEEEEIHEEDMDLSEHEVEEESDHQDDDIESGHDESEPEESDDDEQDEEEDEEQEEEEDEDEDIEDEHHAYAVYDSEVEDAFDQLFDDLGGLDDNDFGEAHWHAGGNSESEIEELSDGQPSPSPRAAHGNLDIFAQYRVNRPSRRFPEEDPDSLFVSRGPNILPPLPLEELLSSVTRNHARAVDLVSELHSEFSRADSPAHNRASRASAGPSRNHQQNHRHHPYGVPQDRARERGRMSDQEGHRNNGLFRDELIEVEMEPPRAAHRRNQPFPLQQQPEIIDLTGEPDSPEEPRFFEPPRPRAPNAAQNPGRNPRRHSSLNQRTPSLSRSDGSFLGNHANFIDLTGDDSPAPARPPLPQQLPRRNNPDIPAQQRQHPRHHHHHHHNQNHHRRQSIRGMPIVPLDQQEGFGARIAGFVRRLDLLHRIGGIAAAPPPHDVEVQIIGGGLPFNMDNPLAGNIPDLDYRGNGGRPGPPKPEHVPPPAAREGFTRDTITDRDAEDVVVCPSCERELKYDPDGAGQSGGGGDGVSPPRPTKKPRNRKDQEEHHFWALKECGHVYCKECYEGRKASAKTSTARFRRDAENSRKLLCAVDGCSTEAVNKLNWVGLFL